MKERKIGHSPARPVRCSLLVGALVWGMVSCVWAQDNACSLATPAELAAALGTKAPDLKPQTTPGGAAPVCTGTTATATVMLRMGRRTSPGGDKEAKGIAAARQMGIKVDVKTYGPVTCSTMVPPPNLAQMGYNTTCSVLKGNTVAAIEVTTKTQQDMVPMEKLRPIAEKMASRI